MIEIQSSPFEIELTEAEIKAAQERFKAAKAPRLVKEKTYCWLTDSWV